MSNKGMKLPPRRKYHTAKEVYETIKSHEQPLFKKNQIGSMMRTQKSRGSDEYAEILKEGINLWKAYKFVQMNS